MTIEREYGVKHPSNGQRTAWTEMALLLAEECESFTVLDFVEFWDLHDADRAAICYLLHDLARKDNRGGGRAPPLRIKEQTRHPDFRGRLNHYQLNSKREITGVSGIET